MNGNLRSGQRDSSTAGVNVLHAGGKALLQFLAPHGPLRNLKRPSITEPETTLQYIKSNFCIKKKCFRSPERTKETIILDNKKAYV